MPIFEYICKKCDCKFEIFHRGGGKIKIGCPECKSKQVQKLFSVFGFSSGGTFVSSDSGNANCTSCNTKNCSSCGK